MAAIVLPSDEDSIAIFVDGTGYHVMFILTWIRNEVDTHEWCI